MTHDSMLVNGVRLHVAASAGDGEPLILVHGGWTDHTTWGLLAAPLAHSFRVLRYDRRGHSGSERGPGPAPRRQDEDDLAALIEAANGGPVHLVGTSYGASIALALAGRRPEIVRSVVAHEPPLLAIAPEPEFAALVAEIQQQIAAGDAAAATRRFFESIGVAWEKVPERVQRAAIGNAQTFLDLRHDPDWTALDVGAVARFPGPILITHGDTDPPWLRRVAATVAERIGRAAWVIPGAGHTPHHTHPEAFSALIDHFARSQALTRAA